MNEKASLLCKKHKKLPIVAADAHIKNDLGSALNIFEAPISSIKGKDKMKTVLRTMEPKFRSKRIPLRNLYISQILKGIKQRKFSVIYRNIAKYILNYTPR